MAAGTLELRFTLNSLVMSVSRCPRPGGSCPQDLQEQPSSAGIGLSPAVRGPGLGIPGLGWTPGGDGQWGAGVTSPGGQSFSDQSPPDTLL